MTQKPHTYAGDLDALRHSPAFAHLVSQPRWLTWEWVENPKNHKWTKPPLQPHGLAKAEVDNPATWGGFDLACDSVRAHRCDGIGIALLGADIAAVDLDHCRDPKTGAIEPWAQELVDQSGTYTEITVSGRGLRLIGRASGGHLHRRFSRGNGGGAVELYRKCPRYITISAVQTGSNQDLVDIDQFLDDLAARLEAEKASRSNGKQGCFTADGKIDLNAAKPRQDPQDEDHSRSGEFNRLLWQLAGNGLSLEDIIKQIEHDPAAERYVREGRLEQEAERSYTKWRSARQIAANGGAPPGGGPPPPAAGTVSPGPAPSATGKTAQSWPQIIYRAEELPRVLNESEDALLQLIAAGREIYQRGGDIVRPVVDRVKSADDRQTQSYRLISVSARYITEVLMCAAQFVTPLRRGGIKVIACPQAVAQGYVERRGHWRLPVLAGIVSTPVMRPDGSILDVPGLDTATGLLFKPSTKFPAIPTAPSREDAERALAYLKGAIKTFPFISGADRSVALSGFLTALHRRSIPTAPMHAFSAKSRTGKSKLVNGIAIVATGDEMPVVSPSNDDKEVDKQLGSELASGAELLSLDNWDRTLRSARLCQVLTEQTLAYRVFVVNDARRVPTSATIFATGVNFRVAGDLKARTLRGQMDAGVERPERRVFPHNFVDWVRGQRGELVCAILTILKAWHLERGRGTRMDVAPFGGYETWSRDIREALLWLGESDPCDTIELIIEDEPQHAGLVGVATQWAESGLGLAPSGSRGQAYTGREILQAAEGVRVTQPEFYEVLERVASGRRGLNAASLGEWLAFHAQGEIISFTIGENKRPPAPQVKRGRIVRCGTRGGSALWRLEEV
jgi:hypothetical protein